MTRFLLAFFWLVTAACGPVVAEEEYPPVKTIEALISQIQSSLPQGWSVSFDQKTQYVEITRDAKVLATFVALNVSGAEKPEMMQYFFGFQIVPYLSKEAYARATAENKPIIARMDAIQNELHPGPLWGGMDSYHPRNEEERKKLTEYDRLNKSLQELPNYWFQNISLRGPLPWDSGVGPIDQKINDECTRIRDRTLHLLSHY